MQYCMAIFFRTAYGWDRLLFDFTCRFLSDVFGWFLDY